MDLVGDRGDVVAGADGEVGHRLDFESETEGVGLAVCLLDVLVLVGEVSGIAVEGGYIDIDELQLSVHRRLAASVFLNGLRHPEDLKLISVTK